MSASALFSASEAAILSISPDRVAQLIQKGGAKAKTMKFMSERSNEILTTVLVGNNIVNILAASLMTILISKNFKDDVITMSSLITTVIILIFSEIIPKMFARAHSEKASIYAAHLLQIIFYLFWPLMQGITWLTKLSLGKNALLRGRIVTKNDIEFMVNQAEFEKTIDSKQIRLISSILDFPTIKVKDIMVPRGQVKFIDSTCSFDQVCRIFNENRHSRYPVCRQNLNEVIGFLHIKDISFLSPEIKRNFKVRPYLKAPLIVYEHMKIQTVFDHMNRRKVHMALVKDETNLVVGMITLEDIIEEIVGSINDEHDPTAIIPMQNDVSQNHFLVKGSISLRDLHSDYDINIPLNDNYSTFAGFLLNNLGNDFPEEGKIIEWQNFSFELTEVQNQEIKKVRIVLNNKSHKKTEK